MHLQHNSPKMGSNNYLGWLWRRAPQMEDTIQSRSGNTGLGLANRSWSDRRWGFIIEQASSQNKLNIPTGINSPSTYVRMFGKNNVEVTINYLLLLSLQTTAIPCIGNVVCRINLLQNVHDATERSLPIYTQRCTPYPYWKIDAVEVLLIVILNFTFLDRRCSIRVQ